MNLHAPFRELYPSLWKTTNRAAQKTENIKNIDTLKRASLLRSHNPGNGFISVIKARGENNEHWKADRQPRVREFVGVEELVVREIQTIPSFIRSERSPKLLVEVTQRSRNVEI